MKIKLRRTSLYLTTKQYDEIYKESKERCCTFSEVFRIIVEKYLEKKLDNKNG
jgi:hypothetical protein